MWSQRRIQKRIKYFSVFIYCVHQSINNLKKYEIIHDMKNANSTLKCSGNRIFINYTLVFSVYCFYSSFQSIIFMHNIDDRTYVLYQKSSDFFLARHRFWSSCLLFLTFLFHHVIRNAFLGLICTFFASKQRFFPVLDFFSFFNQFEISTRKIEEKKTNATKWLSV